jgi:hypothetical protein
VPDRVPVDITRDQSFRANLIKYVLAKLIAERNRSPAFNPLMEVQLDHVNANQC